MITPSTYNYYIARIADWYIRFGFNGKNIAEQKKYLSTFATDVEFLGTLQLPIKIDLDKGSGEGTRCIGESIVSTCKLQRQMITIKKQSSKTFLEYQKEFVVTTRRSQEELLLRKGIITESADS